MQQLVQKAEMGLSPEKIHTPRRPILTKISTPNQLSTPKTPRRFLKNVETPECFNKVQLETPKVNKENMSQELFDEICNLRVAIRIRPMNSSELEIVGSEDVIKVKEKQIIVCPPKYHHYTTNVDHTFSYDHVFWSVEENNPLYSKQEDVFVTLGAPLLNSAFKGFNACLFAYGQTGSGKSYSMMGNIDSDELSGIIPRFCRELFKRVDNLDNEYTVTVEVSYFEIYNEKIHDLLSNQKSNVNRVPLKVREHPVLGPYVADLTTHVVKDYSEIRNFLIIGNKNRAVASTAMNDFSSRSHSIFSIEIGQSQCLNDTDTSLSSKVSLVDLAGSERLKSSFNNEEKMKQSVYINKSLLTLGKCISALADPKKNQFIPYRDSVLTWLLRESLGGNSLTSMLATISPASTHLEETLSTLRYACQARTIVNRARVNESPHDKLVRELRSEVERLRALRKDYERKSLTASQSSSSSFLNESEVEVIKSKLEESERKLNQAEEVWKERYMRCRQKQLEEMVESRKLKEELESKVRILNSVEDTHLSPYKSNFLEELEEVLGEDEKKTERCEVDMIENVHNWCTDNGLICIRNSDNFKITDHKKSKYVIIPLKTISMKGFKNAKDFLDSLHWFKNGTSSTKLNKAEIESSMNKVYQMLEGLHASTVSDNYLNLLYARVNKALQKYETELLHNVKAKTVTFNLDS